MKLPFRPPTKKKTLNAATARRMREADYTEEPNVKLSSAFLVVLLLHVVAVGGIYAFNAIKSNRAPSFAETETPVTPSTAQPVANAQLTDNPATTQADAPVAATAPLTYRVKSGDTIAKIATAYSVTAPSIIDLNHLRDSGGIHVGQDLQLPAGAIATSTGEKPDAPKVAVLKDSGATYTVLHGDTPVSIARKLHVGYDDLIRLNKIDDPKKLKIGAKLKVPAKHSTALASTETSH